MRIIYWVILKLLTITMINCNDPIGLDDNLKKTITDNVLMPLSQTNKWTYQRILLNEKGDTILVDTSVYRVISVLKLSNQIWYRLYDNNQRLNELTVTNFDDGVWVVNSKGDNTDISKAEKELIFKYPALKGQQYIVRPANFTNGNYFARFVVEIDKSISISGKDYETYFYRDEMRDANANILYHPYADYFIAPNVGIVKIIYYEIDDAGEHYPKEIFELLTAEISKVS